MKKDLKDKTGRELDSLLKRFYAGADFEFDPAGEKGAGLLETASAIREAASRKAPEESSVCLYSEDRGFIMAAILAALSGGPELILPHVLTEQVIIDACRAGKTKTVISEKMQTLPEHLLQIVPEKNESSPKSLSLTRDLDVPFLWLYSGGSTGRPIIWPKTPLNLFGEAIYLKEYFKITPDDLILASVSPRHIYGLLFSVLLPFVARARIIKGSPVFPAEIIERASSSRSTIYIGAPLHYKALAVGGTDPGSVRLAFSSGGFLDKAHSLAFSKTAKAPVEEVYGSTETGGIAHRSRMRDETGFKAFPVISWKIEEERLMVKSPFISPSLPLDDKGYFLTGDRAGLSGEGFELFGRVDNVVKVGGNRVELDAVEQKIRTLETIKDVFIFQVSSKQGRDSEVAAIVVSSLDIKELKKLFRRMLSPVEMPRHILKVDAIPVTPAGKRDRQAALSLIRG
jgi:acyl-coenzyme A synthetase/AMP-(fatty) acid ligase